MTAEAPYARFTTAGTRDTPRSSDIEPCERLVAEAVSACPFIEVATSEARPTPS